VWESSPSGTTHEFPLKPFKIPLKLIKTHINYPHASNKDNQPDLESCKVGAVPKTKWTYIRGFDIGITVPKSE
jgi:hypothetical protein